MKFRRSALLVPVLVLILGLTAAPVLAMGLLARPAPDVLITIKTLFYATGMPVIFGLIALDLILGVAVALQTRTFKWEKLGQFYLTMVVPYVLSYAGIYAVDLFVPDLLGPYLDTALVSVAFGAIVSRLLPSVGGHLVALGLQSKKPPMRQRLY